jgi:hypothetical protein
LTGARLPLRGWSNASDQLPNPGALERAKASDPNLASVVSNPSVSDVLVVVIIDAAFLLAGSCAFYLIGFRFGGGTVFSRISRTLRMSHTEHMPHLTEAQIRCRLRNLVTHLASPPQFFVS